MKRICFAFITVVFSACSPTSGGAIQFTTSGEVLALTGYDFPPTSGSVAFVDGWAVHFDRVLVTIDKITLSQNPDTAPTDPSQTGRIVAEFDGPWAIDLHSGGPLAGEGGSGEQAFPIATIDKQNLNGNAAFDPTQRYAFGFDLVAASPSATVLNIDAADADYAEMAANGWTVLYVGTATWNGGTCVTTNAAFDFGQLPTTVQFRFGFASPSSYVNCQNPRNDPATPLTGEEHERGIQITANATVPAQVTVHTDHPFWEALTHDSPAHFDQLAALAKSGVVTLDDAIGVDYTAFTTSTGPLPWRACLPMYMPRNSGPQMGFDSLSINHVPNGDPSKVLRDYRDFMLYTQSTQGHLNADGLCYVKRHYPSPP